MQMQRIRKIISKAVADEKRTRRLAGIMREIAKIQGKRPKPADINGAVAFIQDYIEHVPVLLESTAAVAKQKGIAGKLMPILKVAEQYFLNPQDVIPDHLGLVGLMDDAYFALSLIQAISDSYRQATACPLLPLNLIPANRAIRVLIGEPFASQLDLGVAATFALPTIQQGLEQLIPFGQTLPVDDPIWGGANIDEIVDARLGAMGVV